MISLAKVNYCMLTFLNILFKHILSFCEELLPQLLPPLLMGDLLLSPSRWEAWQWKSWKSINIRSFTSQEKESATGGARRPWTGKQGLQSDPTNCLLKLLNSMAPLLVIKCENHISDHDHGNFADDIVIIVINGKMIATILMTIIMMATFASPPTSSPSSSSSSPVLQHGGEAKAPRTNCCQPESE